MVEEGGFEPPKLVATDLQSQNYQTFIGDSRLFSLYNTMFYNFLMHKIDFTTILRQTCRINRYPNYRAANQRRHGRTAAT